MEQKGRRSRKGEEKAEKSTNRGDDGGRGARMEKTIGLYYFRRSRSKHILHYFVNRSILEVLSS